MGDEERRSGGSSPQGAESTEHLEREQISMAAWPANVKFFFDSFGHRNAISLDRSQAHAERLFVAAEQALLNAIGAAHAMTMNAIQTTNKDQLQVTRLVELATDSQWSPVEQGAGNVLTSGSYPPNRAIDTATAGVGVSAEAVAAAVAKSVDASVTPLIAVISDLVKAISQQTGKAAPAA